MRRIDFIVIHCSATKPSQDVGVDEIRCWHRQRGFSDVGYHRIIRRDGRIEKGRKDAEAGAHVSGYNSHSIGVCLVGGIDEKGSAQNNFTRDQWKALAKLIPEIQKAYGVPRSRIFGHRDMPAKAGVLLEQIGKGTGFTKAAKACPCFDAREWARDTLPS